MEDVLVVLQSPLQLLSFREAHDFYQIKRATLIYESSGVGSDTEQFRALVSDIVQFAEVCIIDQGAGIAFDDYFSAHISTVTAFANRSFDAVFLGHIHEWMRDYLVGRDSTPVFILDDGMETILNFYRTKDLGLNLEYSRLNFRHHRETPYRSKHLLDRAIQCPVHFFSFLNLNSRRSTRHHWPALKATMKAPESSIHKHYFLGQGGWVKKGVLSASRYLHYVEAAMNEFNCLYIPHRWDSTELLSSLQRLGCEIVNVATPWELHIATIRNRFSVVSLASTALLTSLLSPANVSSYFIDFRQHTNETNTYNRQDLHRILDYLRSEEGSNSQLYQFVCI